MPAKASRAARVRFPSFAILLHLDAHGAGRAQDDLHSRFDVVGVQIFHLRFGDFFHLSGADVTNGFTRRVVGAGFNLSSLLQVVRRRGRLDVHGEGLILIVGDHGWARCAWLHVCGLGVERLAEFHDVDAALTQSRAHWRGGVCLTCRNLQLHRTNKLLSHLVVLSTRAGRVLPGECCVVGFQDRDPLISHERISP
ncbi:hypothetical protein RSK20926_11954 [Roseobacter sp. SK209-2-6]|nr:hypothetical protein RSK20926_11954 [Roseobacter sp. SK209-2-6]